ncbi:hypothetical protein SAMN05216573_1423 [Bradyrhizobium sp. Rc3b]|nr:hypothetical protein SAMN05216573_1423 [Bradyrhizobium sp. Rc3b]
MAAKRLCLFDELPALRTRLRSRGNMARQIARPSEGGTSRRLRNKSRCLFPHLKRILKLDRLRLRRPNGGRDRFILAAIAQNLRTMAKLIPMRPRARIGSVEQFGLAATNLSQ